MRLVPILGIAAITLALPPTQGDELKSGPEKKAGSSFQVTAVTGANKGKTLCYV